MPSLVVWRIIGSASREVLGISQGHFHRGLGLRIDLALMSVTGADALVACAIAR
ncbi:MAG: hypothetical protein QOJ63_2452, partial [Solirubrobacteraceae bacterium]|nr:hypothetical protein [Solirubrobacteraceae bacterium]